jgi:hypothetical protein
MHTGRNEACPCGSGKKFKRCCGNASAAPPNADALIALFHAGDFATNVVDHGECRKAVSE